MEDVNSSGGKNEVTNLKTNKKKIGILVERPNYDSLSNWWM